MEKKIKNFFYYLACLIYQFVPCRMLAKVILLICVSGFSSFVFADDILTGTDTTLIDTLNGTGKKYVYIVEGILSLAAYIKTKNLLFLAGIVIVAFFFNLVLTLAGATPNG